MSDRSLQVPLGRRLWNPEARLAYLLLAPAVVVLAVFMFYPILYVFVMAFSRTNRISQVVGPAGLDNFRELFATRQFWVVTGRSVMWTVLAVAAKALLGMTIAVILNVKFSGRKIARLFFIVPWASAVPISAILWRWVYHPDYGLLNHTLRALGLVARPPIWLGDPVAAFTACIWVDIWIGIPFMALVFLAGMQAISEDLYESAYLDGVSWWQKFLYITLPGIRHVVLIATLLSCLWTFNDFNVIYILTRGGPAETTDILITSIYKTGFEYRRFSQASGMAVITFIILSALSVIYARVYFRQEKNG